MKIIVALLICLAVKITYAIDLECPNRVSDASRPVFCDYPGDLDNGQVFLKVGEQYPVKSRLRYFCDDGFILEGPSSLECRENGCWSAKPPICIIEVIVCENLGPIENGRVQHIPPNIEQIGRPESSQELKLDQYTKGSVLRYNCDDGYKLLGRRSLTCRSTGSWSSQQPVCEKEIIFCENPGPIQNGNVQHFPPPIKQRTEPSPSEDFELDQYPEGSVLEYSCEEGYRLFGSRSLTCTSTGSWLGQQPLCEPDCGRSFMQSGLHGRVGSGGNTISGEWPWVVSISIDDNKNSRFICGGAVINTHTVITAAHCLESNMPLLLRFGKHQFNVRDDDTEVLSARSSRIIIHPSYTNTTYDSDIALIIFHPRIRYSYRVQPICLPTRKTMLRNIQRGQIGYVGGWGVTDLALPPEKMMLASLPVVTDRECMNAYRQQNLVLTQNMFCAGYEDARESVCEGDSGSPFVFYGTRTERYTLEGLVSYAIEGQCSVIGKYAIFTKVFRFVRWINRNLR